MSKPQAGDPEKDKQAVRAAKDVSKLFSPKFCMNLSFLILAKVSLQFFTLGARALYFAFKTLRQSQGGQKSAMKKMRNDLNAMRKELDTLKK